MNKGWTRTLWHTKKSISKTAFVESHAFQGRHPCAQITYCMGVHLKTSGARLRNLFSKLDNTPRALFDTIIQKFIFWRFQVFSSSRKVDTCCRPLEPFVFLSSSPVSPQPSCPPAETGGRTTIYLGL